MQKTARGDGYENEWKPQRGARRRARQRQTTASWWLLFLFGAVDYYDMSDEEG